MSSFLDKIKRATGLDKMAFLFSFVIIGVGLASFGIGRLSVGIGPASVSDAPIMLVEGENSGFPEKRRDIPEKRYIASKNGTKYYPLGCAGGNRIKEENKIWLSSKEEAEKLGYSLSTTCK